MPGLSGGNKPSGVRPRPGGGFNQNIGAFNEQLDENAMMSAMGQKQQNQQAADPSSAQGAAAAQKLQQQGAAQQLKQQPPREMGSLGEELITRPAKDILKGLASFFDLNALLGGQPTDTPEDQAKKRQMFQRLQQLNQEEQAVVKQKYQERLQKKQAEEQEQQQKKEAEAQQKKQTIAAPSSPKKGPAGPGMSKKQKATAKLEQDRQTLSSPSGAN